MDGGELWSGLVRSGPVRPGLFLLPLTLFLCHFLPLLEIRHATRGLPSALARSFLHGSGTRLEACPSAREIAARLSISQRLPCCVEAYPSTLLI